MAVDSQKDYKRRQYYIKKDFQSRFIVKFCLLILLGAVLSTAILLLLSQGSLTSTYQNSKLVIKSTASTILPAILYTNLITLALITSAMAATTLFISHRLAGPIFRVEKALKEVKDGNLNERLMLRKKDQLVDLADGFNNMTESLKTKLEDVTKQVDEAAKLGKEQGASKEVTDTLQEISRTINREFSL